MTFEDEFRRAITACMEIEGVTAYRLSIDLHISQTHIGRFLKGQRGLSLQAMNKLAFRFNLHVMQGNT